MADSPKPQHTVAEIFRKHLGDYKQTHKLSYEQSKAARDIMNCRTPALGGVLNICNNDQCKHWEFSYKSCKNRNCPQCQSFEKAQWLEAQKLWLLPISYFHVVFTIDHVFNPLVWWNQESMYSFLIETAVKLLKAYGQKYLGGELGFTVVVHTWGQTLQQHLHLHVIVTGGALVKTANGHRWQSAKNNYLFPAEKFSADFRHAFCAGVQKLWQAGELNTQDGKMDVAAMLAVAQKKDWEVFIEASRNDNDPEKLIEYLARYVFRIAISNHRILEVKNGQVTFEYYDNLDKVDGLKGKLKRMTIPAVEFIGRFLMHVLPSHFVRVRHFGLHNSSCRQKLQQARQLLGLPAQLPAIQKLRLLEWLKQVLQIDTDPRLCPVCNKGILVQTREFGPVSGWHTLFLPILGAFERWKFAAQ
ncbi:MAG: transposase [Anaerolineae bacterium]|nr:transposase [Anaerolineae bacterium]